MKKSFEIPKTPEIMALCAKYDNYAQNYVVWEEEATLLSLIPKITEWEKVILYGLIEYRTKRNFAKAFGITEYRAKETIRDIRYEMKKLYKAAL